MNKGSQFNATELAYGNTDSLQLAATAIALDIPLSKSNPYTTAAGHGIKDKRIIFHFEGNSPEGNSFTVVAKAWQDEKWLSDNPNHELSAIKYAFEVLRSMANHAKGIAPYVGKKPLGISSYTASTAAAATLVALGHPCIGYVAHMGSIFWHFNTCAQADLALWEDRDIHLKLPNSKLAYIKCALLNWKDLVDFSKSEATYQAVKHNGKTAYVSKNDDKNTINILDKLLHAKNKN